MNLKKYIRNLKFRERFLMDFAVGTTILGGIATASSDVPSGLVLIYGGIYSAALSHEYRHLIKQLINNKQYVKKMENDIK